MFYRTTGVKAAFSMKQQSAYGMPLPVSEITSAHPCDFALMESPIDKFNDAGMFGKGHEYPTYQENLTADTQISLNFDGSSYILLWAWAFALGNVVTTQPDSTNSPLVYQHVMKLLDIDDPTIEKQLPVTTYCQAISSADKTLYPDMMVKSTEVSGKTGEQLKVKVDLIGSGRKESTTMTMPELAITRFLRFADIVFSYGGVLISAELKDFTFSHSNEVAEKDGYHPSSGYQDGNSDAPQVRGRCLLTKRSTTLKFKLLMKDNTFQLDDRSNEVKDLSISATGGTIENEFNHKFVIDIPKTVLKNAKIGSEDNLLTVEAEATLLWDTATGAPFTVTVTTNVPSVLDLPA